MKQLVPQDLIDREPSKYLLFHKNPSEDHARMIALANDYAKAMINAELSRLNSQWDLNDYPDEVEPQNATEANLIYCALKRLHMKSEESA